MRKHGHAHPIKTIGHAGYAGEDGTVLFTCQMRVDYGIEERKCRFILALGLDPPSLGILLNPGFGSLCPMLMVTLSYAYGHFGRLFVSYTE